MPMKGSGEGELTVIDEFDGGVGWIAYPDETMRRASHAVESDGELWVLDPVDVDGLDDLLAEYAPVGGVAVLLDRHKRDAAAIAERHGVSVFVPEWMGGVVDDIDAPTERFSDELAGFSVRRLVDNPFWQEAALFDGETLVVPEALGTVDYFRTASEDLGVHPMLRPVPPKCLKEYDPERLLVGHGEGVLDAPAAAIQAAVDGARKGTLPLYAKNLAGLVGLR
ncbi:beta-lactamase domain protein [Natronomonas pharaonis DSM 2160]|uniref:Beta-lactamase domain protein n=1 Tax=Natronomonas pharaonis (strain ATCC 35678 / DSM 2160 / CIP 103997 / JCM 8858 / NBRC 14720 / NCIMB 2260 / Gabara) TaxID=348780 RepID=A0A1U7EY96_NATPD|nr:hypothetical protein [Natronomonas pharaonis]CAI50194.1 beta-lactamase domain protein [Natronomonas pharaonis DSM 2160]